MLLIFSSISLNENISCRFIIFIGILITYINFVVTLYFLTTYVGFVREKPSQLSSRSTTALCSDTHIQPCVSNELYTLWFHYVAGI